MTTFVDSNIPMYLVGASHPNKARARELVAQLAGSGERLVTGVEVYQEILHRYTYLRRPRAIDDAVKTLDDIVDGVLLFGRDDIRVARAILAQFAGLSARDALHIAVMRRADINRILSFDAGFDACPGIARIR